MHACRLFCILFYFLRLFVSSGGVSLLSLFLALLFPPLFILIVCFFTLSLCILFCLVSFISLLVARVCLLFAFLCSSLLFYLPSACLSLSPLSRSSLCLFVSLFSVHLFRLFISSISCLFVCLFFLLLSVKETPHSPHLLGPPTFPFLSCCLHFCMHACIYACMHACMHA